MKLKISEQTEQRVVSRSLVEDRDPYKELV